MSDDCISRQAAIDFIAAWHLCNPNEPRWSDNEVVNFLKSRPSAQPKRGKWIKDGDTYALYKCSACNEICPEAGWANCIKKEQMYKTFKFCPHCGARMDADDYCSKPIRRSEE